MDAKLRDILSSQRRTITVLSSLIAVQNQLGYLPPEAIPAVAEFTGSTINEVYGVATFYTHFRFKPPGQHQIELCWGPACHIVNSPKLRHIIEDFTGLEEDGTTADRRYTFRSLECAGACGLGPVGKIDGKLYGRLTDEKLRGLLQGLDGKPALPAREGAKG